MHKITVLIITAMLIMLPMTLAHSYLYDWEDGSSFHMTDPAGDTGMPGRDITGAWHAHKDGFHYFRMDLQAAPVWPAGYTNLYGIYIDSRAGGVAGPVSLYIPSTLTGIDQVVDSHYSPYAGGWYKSDYHYDMYSPDPMTWSIVPAPATDIFLESHTEGGGTVLEWQVMDDQIGGSFVWWAATHDWCELNGQSVTYDITEAATVPIPGAAWLMLSGLAGLAGLRRRHVAL